MKMEGTPRSLGGLGHGLLPVNSDGQIQEMVRGMSD